jgi:pilus assembly protein Flp/PilA
MNSFLRNIQGFIQVLLERQDGQDLVEYALVVGLVAFGATAGMTSLASGINHAYVTLSTTLASDVT